MTSTLTLIAVIALGLQAGALLAEGAVLVPFWRSLPPATFLRWYRENGTLLLHFYGPLEVVAALLAVLAAVVSRLTGGDGAPLLIVASVLSVALLAMFPIYFQRANASFAEASIEPDRVKEALSAWARWHWARVGLAAAAFLAAALAV